MLIREVTDHLESIAPLALQESYDNAGLLVGIHEQVVEGVLVSLDTTEAVVEEAILKNCNLIIAHHPIIFGGLKRINGYHYVERAVIKAIKHDVAIYAIHTNLDNVLYHGVNQKIGAQIGLQNMKILSPREVETTGSGLIGQLPNSLPVQAFLSHLSSSMQLSYLKHTKLIHDEIQTVALCGGSGRFQLQPAISSGAQVFISADFKYHEYFEANDQIIVADIGHYESEQYTIDLLVDILSQKFTTPILKTEVNTNPVQIKVF